MTTSPKTLWKSISSRDGEPLTKTAQAYVVATAQNEAHELVLKTFLHLAENDEITKAEIARRLGKSPAQITRWLTAPGNWTIETASLLLAAMGEQILFSAQPYSRKRNTNDAHPAAYWTVNQLSTKPHPRSSNDQDIITTSSAKFTGFSVVGS